MKNPGPHEQAAVEDLLSLSRARAGPQPFEIEDRHATAIFAHELRAPHMPGPVLLRVAGSETETSSCANSSRPHMGQARVPPLERIHSLTASTDTGLAVFTSIHLLGAIVYPPAESER